MDGIPQLGSPHVIHKPGSFQKSPEVPDHSTEAEKAVEYDGLPPLGPKTVNAPLVLFKNVKNVFISANNAVLNQFSTSDSELGIVIVHNGSISCAGTRISCLVSDMSEVHVVDLKGDYHYADIIRVEDSSPRRNCRRIYFPRAHIVRLSFGTGAHCD